MSARVCARVRACERMSTGTTAHAREVMTVRARVRLLAPLVLISAGLVMLALPMPVQAAKPAVESADVKRGREVFQYWCVACHGNGPMKPGTTALQAKYNGVRPAKLEDRTDLTPALTKYFVRTGVNVMPPFRKTEISDADLKALGAYLARPRSARK